MLSSRICCCCCCRSELPFCRHKCLNTRPRLSKIAAAAATVAAAAAAVEAGVALPPIPKVVSGSVINGTRDRSSRTVNYSLLLLPPLVLLPPLLLLLLQVLVVHL